VASRDMSASTGTDIAVQWGPDSRKTSE